MFEIHSNTNSNINMPTAKVTAKAKAKPNNAENEPFRKLQSHLRQLRAGGTNASVLQALANMCREEEEIIDRQTYFDRRKLANIKEETKTPESLWRSRFVRRSSWSKTTQPMHNATDENEEVANLFTKYVKRKYRGSPQEEEKKPSTFSVNVQDLLLSMTTMFATDINDAYVSDPSQTMAIGENNPFQAMMKMNQIDENMKAIDDDMRILAQARKEGQMTAKDRFTGFAQLGENDCLLDEEASSDDSRSESDSSDDSGESDSSDDDDSGESGSDDDDASESDQEDDSEWDSGDDSSLDSNFMTEMAHALGFDVGDQAEDDESLATMNVALIKAIASGEKSLPDLTHPQLTGIQITTMVLIPSQNDETPRLSQAVVHDSEAVEQEEGNGSDSESEREPESDDSDSDSSDSDSDGDDSDSEDSLLSVSGIPGLTASTIQGLTASTIQGLTASTIQGLTASTIQGLTASTAIISPAAATITAKPSGTDARKQKALATAPPSGVGTNVGCFDAAGKPNEKAAIRRSTGYYSAALEYDDHSDLCIAARFAALADEEIAPFAVKESPKSPKTTPTKRNIVIDDADSGDESLEPDEGFFALSSDFCDMEEEGEESTQDRDGEPTIDPSAHLDRAGVSAPDQNILPTTTVEDEVIGTEDSSGSILVDWDFTGTALLVGWGDGPDSDSDSVHSERGLIVSTWKPTSNGDATPTTNTESPSLINEEMLLSKDQEKTRSSAPSNYEISMESLQQGVFLQERSRKFSSLASGDKWDSSQGLLVGWGDGLNSDSDSVHSEREPIVSTWKPTSNGDETPTTNTESPSLMSVSSNEETPIRKDQERTRSSSPSNSEISIESLELGAFLQERSRKFSSLETGGKSASSDGICITQESSMVAKILPKAAIRKSNSRRKSRPQTDGRRDSFRDAFQNLSAEPDVILEESEVGEEANIILVASPSKTEEESLSSSDEKKEVAMIFPRVEFQTNGEKGKKRRTRKGREEDSLDTRGRRKLRENQIKSTMEGQQCFIEGLCIVNKSRGKTIGGKIKSQV
jgi:hypothetical protein